MALRNYNNNERNITNSTFSSIVFSNAESSIMQSKFSIGYFNKLMKISIALRNNAGSKDAYATYDNDNQINVYVSYTKAYMLARMIEKFQQDPNIHNVCIELKNGLLKVSDGSEYNGAGVPCISISYADESGNAMVVMRLRILSIWKLILSRWLLMSIIRQHLMLLQHLLWKLICISVIIL